MIREDSIRENYIKVDYVDSSQVWCYHVLENVHNKKLKIYDHNFL